MKEAMLYKGGKRACKLFPVLPSVLQHKRRRQRHLRSEENIKGNLYSLVYGKVIAAHVDP